MDQVTKNFLMTNEYEKQGIEFLEKHNIKMEVKFLKHDFYFVDDKEKRDIFKITFKRKNKQFSLTFGQAINSHNEPTPYDVLTCLEKYEIGSFEDFCLCYGYDDYKLSEYPKVKKIYNACVKQYKQVKNFFTDKEIEELKEIQ